MVNNQVENFAVTSYLCAALNTCTKTCCAMSSASVGSPMVRATRFTTGCLYLSTNVSKAERSPARTRSMRAASGSRFADMTRNTVTKTGNASRLRGNLNQLRVATFRLLSFSCFPPRLLLLFSPDAKSSVSCRVLHCLLRDRSAAEDGIETALDEPRHPAANLVL